MSEPRCLDCGILLHENDPTERCGPCYEMDILRFEHAWREAAELAAEAGFWSVD